jgi:hypothetical protein
METLKNWGDGIHIICGTILNICPGGRNFDEQLNYIWTIDQHQHLLISGRI